MTGGTRAPTHADPPLGAGAAGARHLPRVHHALPVPGRARPGLRAAGPVEDRAHAEPAAGRLRAGLVRGRVPGPGRADRAVGDQRVRRQAAHRAVPEPPLRGHAPVPRHPVRGSGADVRPAGRGGGARPHRRRADRPADPAGHRAQPPRGPRRLVPAGAPAAERLSSTAAGGDEGLASARPQRGHRGQPAAERLGQVPARPASTSSPSRSPGWPAPWTRWARW